MPKRARQHAADLAKRKGSSTVSFDGSAVCLEKEMDPSWHGD